MLSDPIADMLSRIRNSYLANQKEVLIPYSKLKEEILKLLIKKGYLKDIKIKEIDHKSKKTKTLVCQLKYEGNNPAITKIIRVSKPSLRVYTSRKKLPRVLGGIGIAVISTSEGILTAKEAKKKGLGGEIICKVW